MRVLCLVDGPVKPPDRWMWNHLPEEAQQDEVDFLWASPADRFPKWGKFLSYYPQYLALGWRAMQACRRKRYEVIVAWESKTGFPFGALRSLMGMNTPPLVIFAFSFKGVATSFSLVSRNFMRGIDHVTVLFPAEATYYEQVLGVPSAHITVCPFGWHDLCKDAEPAENGDFIFSFGRSYRDYKTFIKAVEDLPVKVIINTRKFTLKDLTIPSHVTVNEMTPEREYARLLASARFVVVPLQETRHAAGESALVQAMAAGKAVVATRTFSASYYVEDGVTGVLTPSKNAEVMREACLYLLNHPEECRSMGVAARRRYEERFTSEHSARCQYAVLQKVVQRQREG